jgi:hypothetical protein
MMMAEVGGSPTPPAPLPYDAEIEYLEGDGASYIDTGVYANNNTSVEIKLRAKTPTQARGIFGTKNHLQFSIYQLNKNTSYSFRFQIGYADSLTGTPFEYQSNNSFNNDYVFYLKKNEFYLNSVIRNTFGTFSFEDTVSSLLFTTIILPNNVESRMFDGRIYYCKIWNDNTLVRDLIPVRVGVVGYMYDQVSRQLFGNQGTGNFILGNDKNIYN